MKKNTSKLHFTTILASTLLLMLALCFTQCTKDEKTIGIQDNAQVEKELLDIDLATKVIELPEGDADNKSTSYGKTFNTINEALKCSGFKATLFSGVKTIFAPSDAAFKKIGLDASNICDRLDAETLSLILSYHVTDSHIEKSDRGCITMSDGNTAHISTVKRYKIAINDNEVISIHNQSKNYFDLNVFMIDGVLEAPSGNLIETMVAEKDLSYVVDLIEAYPELESALSDESTFITVFAPTDRSFRKFLVKNGARSVDHLIEKLGSDVVRQVLSYHVVDECAFTSGFSDGKTFTSLQGGTFKYNRFQDGIVDATKAVIRYERNSQDILATNGIIHQINGVLNPDLDISESGLNSRQTNQGVSSVKASILSAFASIDAIGVAAEISHSMNAASVGKDLNNTELILFGNPRLGTPIMQDNQQAGIDLPQKYLVYEDDNGVTRIAYNDISYLKARHGLSNDIPTLSTMANALNNFASAQSDRMPGPIVGLPEKGEGLIDKISSNSIGDSYDAIVAAITNNPNLRLILELDHQANAARVGLELRPTRLIVFGNPNLGTPLMQSAQSVAIDLPQKILVWEDENQEVHITYNDPAYLQSRHGIKNQQTILTTIAGALDKISDVGAGM